MQTKSSLALAIVLGMGSGYGVYQWLCGHGGLAPGIAAHQNFLGRRRPAAAKPVDEKSAAGLQDLAPVPRLLRFLHDESLRVGQPDRDPQKSAEALSEFAAQLNADQLQALALTALGKEGHVSEDERFLAAYILAQSQDEAALVNLELVASTPFSAAEADSESPQGSIEWLVRAQAIEGYGHFANASENLRSDARESLLRVLNHTSQGFIVSRGARVLQALESSDGSREIAAQDQSDLARVLGTR